MVLYQLLVKQGEKEFRSANIFYTEDEALRHTATYVAALRKAGRLQANIPVTSLPIPLVLKQPKISDQYLLNTGNTLAA